MGTKQFLIIGIVAFLLASVTTTAATSANPAPPDWKFYGGVSSANGQSWCFYDAGEVVREAAGLIRVAAKCLAQTAIDGIDVEHDFAGQIARNAARRQGYRPPYMLTEITNADEMADIVTLEQIADVANIEPRVTLSYELDCGKNLARELSLRVQVNGKVRSVDRPGDWQVVSPEANTVRLVKILCRP